MKITFKTLIATAIVLTVCGRSGAVMGDDAILIKSEELHTGTGEVLRPGCVLIKDGKIIEVGE